MEEGNPIRFQRPAVPPQGEPTSSIELGDSSEKPPAPRTIANMPLSELGQKRGFEEYVGGRPGPTLMVELGSERKIILPYMSFQQAIYRNREILVEFSTAQILVEPKGSFSVKDFLEALQNMRLQTITHDSELCSIRVSIDVVEPKDDTL
jgi:hypothetical protein